MAVVHQSSDKGGCHLLIIQYVDPSGEFQICIQDDDFLFMNLGKIVKQQLGTCPVIGNIPELIQNQDICPGQFLCRDDRFPFSCASDSWLISAAVRKNFTGIPF